MKTICILGGGISGLTSAFYNSFKHKVILIESNSTFGGWISTVKNMETGPRSLRFNLNTLDLINQLNLNHQLVFPTLQSKTRYILVDGKLKQLPGSIPSFLKSPLFKLSTFIKEPFIPKSTLSDESVDDFIKRRFNPYIANYIVASLVHGIYAGDTKKLSVHTLFPILVKYEQKYGSVLKGICYDWLSSLVSSKPTYSDSSQQLQDLIKTVGKHPFYSFQNGMQTLSDALVSRLSSLPNVQVFSNTTCTAIDIQNKIISLSSNNSTRDIKVDEIISTLPANKLSKLTNNEPLNKLLSRLKYANVVVVNLVYPSNTLKTPGFGYLIPPSENTVVLGTVFDSNTFKQDVDSITLMIGGYKPVSLEEQDVLKIAKQHVKDVLNIDLEPIDFLVSFQKDCIPYYEVGYNELLKDIKRTCGDLVLIGSSFNGVSVNDCINSARKMVF